MKCHTCPRAEADRACLGERLTHLCARPEYRGHLATHDDEPARPGLLAMAGAFVESVVELVKDGGRVATLEEQTEREAACRACPHHDHVNDACRSCGCGTIPALSFVGLDLALKRSWASSRCPDDPPRWDAV